MSIKQFYAAFTPFLIIFSLTAGGINEVYMEQPDSIPPALELAPEIYETMSAGDLGSEVSLRIAHITDVHHYAPSLYDPDSETFIRFTYANEGRSVFYTTDLMNALKEDLLKKNIDILLISGDLSILGTRETHDDFRMILNGFEGEGIEVYVATGNHDINNPNAYRLGKSLGRDIDSVDPLGFRDIYYNFGFEEAVDEHDESLSYMAPLGEEYYLLSLDSSWYQDNLYHDISTSAGYFVPSLYSWIEEMLELAKRSNRQVIAMGHHNLLEHYEIDFDLSNFMIRGGQPVVDLLEREGVHLYLSGHIHKGDIKKYQNSHFYGVTTSSLSLYPHVYRLIGLYRDGVQFRSKFISRDSLDLMGEHAAVHNWYRGYERTFLGQYEKMLKNYNQKESYAMAEYFYLVNLYAQAGWESHLPSTILQSQGAELFTQSDSFLSDFARILPLDSPPGDGNIDLSW